MWWWWGICSSCRLHPSSHRKESKLHSAALDPGHLCAKFGRNDPMPLATPSPLAELVSSFGPGSHDQARLKPIFRSPCACLNSKVLAQKGQPALPSPASAALECSFRVLLPSMIRLTFMTLSSLALFAACRQSVAQSSGSITNREGQGCSRRHAVVGSKLCLCHPKSLTGPTSLHSNLGC